MNELQAMLANAAPAPEKSLGERTLKPPGKTGKADGSDSETKESFPAALNASINEAKTSAETGHKAETVLAKKEGGKSKLAEANPQKAEDSKGVVKLKNAVTLGPRSRTAENQKFVFEIKTGKVETRDFQMKAPLLKNDNDIRAFKLEGIQLKETNSDTIISKLSKVSVKDMPEPKERLNPFSESSKGGQKSTKANNDIKAVIDKPRPAENSKNGNQKVDQKQGVHKVEIKSGVKVVSGKSILPSAKRIVDVNALKPEWTRHAVFEHLDSQKSTKLPAEKPTELPVPSSKPVIRNDVKRKEPARAENPEKKTVTEPKSSKTVAELKPGEKPKSDSKSTEVSNNRDKVNSALKKTPVAKDNRVRTVKTADKQKHDSPKKVVSGNTKPASAQFSAKEASAQVKARGLDNLNPGTLTETKLEIPKQNLSKVLPQEVARSITDMVKTNSNIQGRTLSIKLYPPELGSVLLRFTQSRGVININMKVDSEEVFKALRGGMDEVKSILQSSGVNLDKIDIRFDAKFRDMVFNNQNDTPENMNSEGSKGSNNHGPGKGGGNSVNHPGTDGAESNRKYYVNANGVDCLA
ncbi:MAG: hypothetical protein GF307_07510 [candidate division Zixibacteria bacterium]|nr:hypothetical protein [candidate division Zixibacteria bacterium]